MSLNYILRKCIGGYKFTNHKVHRYLPKMEKELENLTQTIRIYSQDLGMEFGIEKCAIPIIKKGKRETTEGIELPNQINIRSFEEKENYKSSEIVEANTMKETEKKKYEKST